MKVTTELTIEDPGTLLKEHYTIEATYFDYAWEEITVFDADDQEVSAGFYDSFDFYIRNALDAEIGADFDRLEA